MKKKLLSLALILIIMLTFSLLTAGPALAWIVYGSDVNISAGAVSNGQVQLTITETNTGNEDIKDVSVTLQANGVTIYTLTKGSTGWVGGDVYQPWEPSKLNAAPYAETWTWILTVPINTTTTFEAVGYGVAWSIDGDVIITPPDYPEEMATVDVTVAPPTGVLLPTAVSVQMYAAGDWPTMYDSFYYGVKNGKINNVSPGVMFYYNTIEAPASGSIVVVQTNTNNWRPFTVQQNQAYLYNTSFVKVKTGTVSQVSDKYLVTFSTSGLTPGATYYIGIKLTPTDMAGQAIPFNAALQTEYFFSTEIGGVLQSGSGDSITLLPKP